MEIRFKPVTKAVSGDKADTSGDRDILAIGYDSTTGEIILDLEEVTP